MDLATKEPDADVAASAPSVPSAEAVNSDSIDDKKAEQESPIIVDSSAYTFTSAVQRPQPEEEGPSDDKPVGNGTSSAGNGQGQGEREKDGSENTSTLGSSKPQSSRELSSLVDSEVEGIAKGITFVMEISEKWTRHPATIFLMENLKKEKIGIHKLTCPHLKGVTLLLTVHEELLYEAVERIGMVVPARDGNSWLFSRQIMEALKKDLKAKNKEEGMKTTTVENEDEPVFNFTSGHRVRAVHEILNTLQIHGQAPPPFKEADMLVERSKEIGIVNNLFPLHDPPTIKKLDETWVKGKWEQPLEDVHDYFGEEIGFYFAFLGAYTYHLILPSLFGIFVFINQTLVGIDNFATTIFSLLLTVWASVFLEMWKRQQAECAYRWGVFQLEEKSLPRPQFKGTLVFDELKGTRVRVFTTSQRATKLMVTIPIVLLSLLVVIVVVFLCLILQDYVDDNYTEEQGYSGFYLYLTYAVTILYVIVSIIMDKIYAVVAKRLTDYENWETQQQYDRWHVNKLVAFHFLNNFLFLLYYTFYKQDMILLKSQMIFLLGLQQVIGNIQETVIPYILARRRTAALKEPVNGTAQDGKGGKTNGTDGNGTGIEQTDTRSKLVQQVEEEANLDEYTSTFADYLELFIQFGNVTLFAAAFPLAPLLALANNIMEIRGDAVALIKSSRRACHSRAYSIGSWMSAFEFLGYCAVVTNCGIIGLTSKQLERWFPDITSAEKVVVVAVVEHVMVLIKLAVEALIPDVPDSVTKGQYNAALAKAKLLQRTLDKESEMEIERWEGSLTAKESSSAETETGEQGRPATDSIVRHHQALRQKAEAEARHWKSVAQSVTSGHLMKVLVPPATKVNHHD